LNHLALCQSTQCSLKETSFSIIVVDQIQCRTDCFSFFEGMASFLLSKTYGLSNHTLKENQSPSCQSKPQSSAGHMVRPPLHRLHNCCRKQCSPVRYTCMHTPALHCSVLLGVLFLWCMLCLINVPLPTGRGGGAGRGPHVPDQPPQGSLYRMPSQMTPPQAATVFYNSQYG
jgi:hypothetical protein